MQHDYTEKDIARFWSKVDKERSEVFYNGLRCWEWVAACRPTGYGEIHMGKKSPYAHRVSYELAFGEIPFEKPLVLHHCDNPLCVRPEHLFCGTDQDNMTDKVNKGRQLVFAEKNSKNEKLTNEKVYEIRRRYGWFGKNGETAAALAKEFGVTESNILSIVSRKTWNNI